MGCAVERTHFVLQVARLFLLLSALALQSGEVMAQPRAGDTLANDLRRNVVRVISRWNDGTPEKNGFGFVVGERDGLFYIVTADHVVRENSIAGTPGIIFYEDQGNEYQGAVLNTHLIKSEGDVAVIRVPSRFSWQAAARSGVAAERGDNVRFIGVQGQWIVPARPGAINGIEPNGTIRFEGMAIRTGTSGAPLVGDKGILGMIIKDDDIYGLATPIDVIERAFRQWSYPWQLTTWAPAGPIAIPMAPVPPQPGPVATTPMAPVPPQTDWRSRFITRDNRDLWLGDIPRPDRSIGIHNVDLDGCARECAQNQECVAFAYDRWKGTCYPKNKITQSLLDPRSTIAVKKPGELPNVLQKTPEMGILRHRRMRGDVTISKAVADYATCSSACEDNLQCVTFNFLKRAGRGDNCQMFKLSDGHDQDNAVDAGYKYQEP
jgi:Trypsin-like peptidase domain/PAN domain